MDIHTLQSFLVIAEEQHVTRAAERLQIAQPNLTRLMRKLEEELGFLLFDRSNKRRFALTPTGEAFLRQITPMLNQYERAVQTARKVELGEGGKLTVGYTAMAIFSGSLPALIQAYQQYPEFDLISRDISSLSRQMVLNMLRDGRLDVAFLPTISEEPELVRELVGTVSLVVVLPINHPLASQRTVPLTALSQDSWIRAPRLLNPHWDDDLSRLFKQAGFEPKVVQLVPQAHMAVSQVAAGIGLTILSSWTQEHLPHPGVVFRPLQDDDYTIPFYAVWRKEDRSPLLDTFLHILRNLRSGQADASTEELELPGT